MPTTQEITEKRKRLRISAPILKNVKPLKTNYLIDLKKSKYYPINVHKKTVGRMVEVDEGKEVQNAKEAVQQQSTKKKKILSFAFFMINIVVIAIILFVQMDQGIVENPLDIKLNWWYILAAAGMVFLIMFMETFKFNGLIRKATGKNRIGLGYKISALGRYYDVITPLATGGQPFQIFYSNKYGIRGGESFSIVMSEHMFQQVAYIILITVVLIGSCISNGGITNIILQHSSIGVVEASLIATLAWIGYVIASALLLVMLVFSLSKKAGVGLVVGSLKAFCFMFRKNYDKMFRKTMRTVSIWQNTMKKYKKATWIWISNVVLSVVYYLAMESIPYFIYCAFMGWDASVWLDIILLTMIIDLAASFNPLPSGTGISDLSFLAIFAAMFDVKNTFWALLIWKIFTYYIFIAQGLCVLTYDYFIGNKKLEKNKAKWATPRYDKIKVKNSLY